MSREEFMDRLVYLLSDITEEEREDAILYYEDYFDEAGAEQEEKVIQELGSPERVAAIIRNGMEGATDGGSFTERGFEDERFRDPNTQIVKRLDLPDVTEQKGKAEDPFGDQTDTQNNTEEHKTESTRSNKQRRFGNRWIKIILFIILLGAAWEFIKNLFGIGMGFFDSVFGILFLPACMCLASVILAIVFLVVAVLNVATPWILVFFLGMTLFCLGTGMLFLVLSIQLYGKWIPTLIKNICQMARNLRDSVVKGKEA